MADIPIVYTLTVCPACDLLRDTWRREGGQYEERRVDQSQDTLDEALDYGIKGIFTDYPTKLKQYLDNRKRAGSTND